MKQLKLLVLKDFHFTQGKLPVNLKEHVKGYCILFFFLRNPTTHGVGGISGLDLRSNSQAITQTRRN